MSEVLSRAPDTIQVNVRTGNYLYSDKRHSQRMRLRDYVEKYLQMGTEHDTGADVRGALPPYSGNTPLTADDFRGLGLAYPFPFERRSFEYPRLWVGPKGSLTPLHYDSRDNLICQYIGRKHVTLFPPSDIRWLYARGRAPSWSGVPDPRQPDLNAFPLFSNARSVEMTINPGEILFLPARWSHFVVNVETSMMVNFWPEHSALGRIGLAVSAFSGRVRNRLGRARDYFLTR